MITVAWRTQESHCAMNEVDKFLELRSVALSEIEFLFTLNMISRTNLDRYRNCMYRAASSNIFTFFSQFRFFPHDRKVSVEKYNLHFDDYLL